MERAGFFKAKNAIRKAATELREQEELRADIREENDEEQLAERVKMQAYVQSLGGKLGEWRNAKDLHQALQTPETSDTALKDRFGSSLLHIAADGSSAETLRIHLQRRADPNVADCLGRSLLHLAVINDDPEAVHELLHFGGNPNLGDCQDWTPVHFAVHLNCYKALSAMLSFSPNFSATNEDGKSPKDYIKNETMRSFVQYCEQYKEDCPHEVIKVHYGQKTPEDSPLVRRSANS